MCEVTIPNGKIFSRDDKMTAFILWKAKLPLKDISNQLQLAKATLKRVLMLPGVLYTGKRVCDDSLIKCTLSAGKPGKG